MAGDLTVTAEASDAPAALQSRPPRLDWRPKIRWFAAEILVVVAGVLIALAINSWWDRRQEAQAEQRLLVALRGEFTANHEHLTEIIAFHETLKKTTLTLLTRSAASDRAPSSESGDSVDQLLADASWWSSYTSLESTVLDAAVQDGQLGLIQSDSLRRLLAQWRSEVSSASAQSTQESMHYQNVWLPLLRAEGELGQISNQATIIPGTELRYQGESVPLPARSTDHRPLLASRAMRNALVQKLWIENDVLHEYRRLEPLIGRIGTALEHEIAK
jgi:hypothetical protein